jgi:putative ABC transport system permease protein
MVMNKSTIKLLFRKIKKNLPQLICVALLITIGAGFFVTLSTIETKYEEATEQYFIDNKYADITYYGDFDETQVNSLNNYDKITLAEGRFVTDYRTESDSVIRVISLTNGVNIPYIYEGEMPVDNTQCLIVKRNAKALNKSIGDTITVNGKSLKITGIIDSPEYIYLVKNERAPMADSGSFVILYTTAAFFHGDYNEIVALGNGVANAELTSLIAAERAATRENQINYASYIDDLDQIETFAIIFPIVFAALIVAIVFVMLKRTVVKEHKQIGVYKALGVSNKTIVALYIGQFGFIALLAALVGCLLTIFLTNIVIGLFSSMFVVPTLVFKFYPLIWLATIAIAFLICAFAGIISLIGTLRAMPSESMRPISPKNGKKIILEKIPVWEKLSFNTRYALKSTLRNKGRFFSVILGICGACALLVFSFGFYDSIDNTGNQYFNDFANYDLIANFNMTPMAIAHPASQLADEYQIAFQFYSDINDEECLITLVENDFDMLKIPSDKLADGVIIPKYYADLWNVKTGGSLTIEGKSIKISSVVEQTVNLSVYGSIEYIASLGFELPSVYNTLFVRSGNIENITDFLKENNITYSTITDDKYTFDSKSESLSILMWFMLICAIILGVTVLYSVGLINLSARQYEYMFMGVMGYKQKSIMSANIKESILQLIISIPIGLLLGNLLLRLIKGAFSGATFALTTAVYLPSYLFSGAIILGISFLMSLVTARQIGKLDIVEGLKVQDD